MFDDAAFNDSDEFDPDAFEIVEAVTPPAVSVAALAQAATVSGVAGGA